MKTDMRVIVMDLYDFGQLVKTLRKNSVDEYGNRWTRESLSSAIHLTTNQLGRLERGDRKYLDNQTLQLLADSLQLTNLEKKEFLKAAIGLSDEKLHSKEDPLAQLNKLIESMESLQVPAYINDVYSDIVAVNTAALSLYQITPELIDFAQTEPVGLNMLYFIYSPEVGYKEIIGSGWRESADLTMLFFRRTSLRYRHTEYFAYIIKEMLRDKQFYIDWHSSHRFQEYQDISYEHFDYKHPLYGPLKYIATETVVHTQKGDLFFMIYNPADSTTAHTFTQIKNNHGNRAYRMAEWPEKIIPA
ncbi:MAG: helix-turn-helix transcriptional regulator [Firmicutes bacterium]|nr:helix-turn-helix transcriptional regulator [Bacillota bacterium]